MLPSPACLRLLALVLGLAPAITAIAGSPADEIIHRPMTYEGFNREYLVYVPPGLATTSAKAPVVLVLHGGGGNPQQAMDSTGFVNKARQENFIAVFPSGTSRFSRVLKTWNAGHCCAFAMSRHTDDIGYIHRVIDEVTRDFPADPDRIYVTGMSNGGMLAHRIGRELSGQVAAIAPVVAGLFGDETMPGKPVPAIIINGALDNTLPFAGGALGRRAADSGDGTPFREALYQSQFWAANNGCQPTPQKSQPNALVEQLAYNCPAGVEVVHVIVKDNGHAWPGGKKGSRRGDTPSSALDATTVIWEFFKQHSRQPH